jgi:hypothetical protein
MIQGSNWDLLAKSNATLPLGEGRVEEALVEQIYKFLLPLRIVIVRWEGVLSLVKEPE